jgi:hypothetical protein
VVLGVVGSRLGGDCTRRTGEEPEGVDRAGDVIARYLERLAGVCRLQPHQQLAVPLHSLALAWDEENTAVKSLHSELLTLGVYHF